MTTAPCGDSRGRGGAVFLVPAATTLLACLWGIGGRSMWRDEHATWWAASLPPADLLRLVRNVDLALAPYYAFMHVWSSVFGVSPPALRMPSALAMAAAAGLVGVIGRRTVGTLGGGLTAGLLFALTPTVVRYGQEARPYAFAVLAVLLSVLALLRALESPRPRRWALYAVTLPLIGWSHLVALAVAAAHGAAVLSSRRQGRPVTRGWIAAVTCGLAATLPLVLLARTQAGQIGWNTTAWNDIAAMPHMLVRFPALTAVVFGGAAFALATTRRGTHVTLLAVWAVAPFLLTLLTAPWLHLFLDRYLLFTLPAWILLAVVGIRGAAARLGAARPRAARWCVAVPAALLVLLASSAREHTTRNTPREPDYRAAAQAVLEAQRPGDGIAYTPRRHARRGLDYELRSGPRPKDVFLHTSPREEAGYAAGECPDPRPCAASHRRVWLVSAGNGDPFAALPGEKGSLLRGEFDVVRTLRLLNVRVLLLERPT
ncbi:glycosyltransferase family 39 protein [Streptomyces finlayi]|nr:glycosyltransferase family 39 protein [Streptomyces finlayi]